MGTITLGFQATVDELEGRIEAAPLDRASYLLPAEVPFTLTFEAEAVRTPMNYADHILPQHRQYISDDPGDFCRQVLTDGYLAPD